MTDPTTAAALAELDRRGRQAARSLRTALAVAEPGAPDAPAPPTPVPPALPRPVDGDGRPGGDLFTLERTTAPPRRYRALAAAAAVVLVAGGVALALGRDDRTTVESETPAAPTADLDGDGTGIRPPEGDWGGLTIAGEGPTVDWQWTGLVPALGTDLVFSLSDERTRTTYVMEDIGDAPLRVATTDLGGRLPGGEVAVYGVVADEVGATDGSVTVEWPGAAPVELDVVEVGDTPTSAGGPTHDLLVGWLPADVGRDAEVVARHGDGTEVARVPLGWTGETAEPDRTGSVYPDGADAPTAGVASEEVDGAAWSAAVTEGGRNVVLSAWGHEDSADTVLTGPGTEPLQALATYLDGEEPAAVAVYGLVDAAAASVRLEPADGDPVELSISSIAGATHEAFGGLVAREGLDEAAVVSYDADGNELARTALGWTHHDVVVRPDTLPTD